MAEDRHDKAAWANGLEEDQGILVRRYGRGRPVGRPWRTTLKRLVNEQNESSTIDFIGEEIHERYDTDLSEEDIDNERWTNFDDLSVEERLDVVATVWGTNDRDLDVLGKFVDGELVPIGGKFDTLTAGRQDIAVKTARGHDWHREGSRQ